MTSWVCKTCGTINQDVLDTVLTTENFYLLERMDKERRRREEYENKGEIPPMPCIQCGEERLQGRVK